MAKTGKKAPRAAKPKQSRTARAAAAGLVPPKASPELASAGEITMKVPPTAGIPNDFKALGQVKKTARSAAGDVGKKVATLVEKKNYNAKALSIVYALNEMPQEKFAITWTHILHLAAAMEFDKRAKLQGEMFQEDDESEDDDSKGTPAGEPDLRPGRGAAQLRSVGGGGQSTFEPVGAALKTGTDD